MNKETVLNCLNKANQDSIIKIYVFSKPYEFEKKYIIYGLEDNNKTLFIEDRKTSSLDLINLNSIKRVEIAKKVNIHELWGIKLQEYVYANMGV